VSQTTIVCWPLKRRLAAYAARAVSSALNAKPCHGVSWDHGQSGRRHQDGCTFAMRVILLRSERARRIDPSRPPRRHQDAIAARTQKYRDAPKSERQARYAPGTGRAASSDGSTVRPANVSYEHREGQRRQNRMGIDRWPPNRANPNVLAT